MSSDGEASEVGEGVKIISLEEVPRKVTLKSSDGEVFEVEETASLELELIKNLIEDGCADEEIPLDNVTGTTLAKLIEYCKKHAGGKYDKKDEELKKWDDEFVEVDMDTLYFLLLGANYMSVKGMLDLCAKRVADTIKGKSVEEIRETFNIKNDFTPEEEKAIRDEYPWDFE